MTPPDLLVNEDGAPISLRRDLARSPAEAVRWLLCEFDWLLEDLSATYDEVNDSYKFDFLELLHFTRGVTPGFMRLAETDEEKDTEWGADTWLPCASTHLAAVPYWEVRE